jgi:hypothetical protein
MDFETNFKKPFTDVKKLLIGILLSIVPIVNFLAIGYMLETARKSMKKDTSLPEWTGWGDLFVKGLLSIVIEAIYFIPAAIAGMIFLWPVMSSAMPMMMQGQIPNIGQLIANMGPAMMGLALAGLLGLFAAYVAPSAIFHFLNGGFNDAFKFGSVLKKAFSGTYGMAWTLFILYSMVLGAVLGYVPYVGSAAATFIAGITGFSLIAEAFGNGKISAKREFVKKSKKGYY